MDKFNRDNRENRDRRGRDRSFDRRDSFGDRGRERREMHKTICSQCGVSCEVPFRPTSSKPVYCDNCFGSKGREERRFDRQDRFEDRRENKFEKTSSITSKCNCNCKEGLDILAKKLDVIINILTPKVAVKEESKENKKIVTPRKEEKEKKEKKEIKDKVVAKKKATPKKKK